jgi:methyl coenzyme M reductase subunit D
MQTYTGTPDIDILPRRLMGRKKAEDFTIIIKEMDQVEDVFTKNIPFKGGGHIVGRFIVILKPGADPEAFVRELKPVMEQTMPFGYEIRLGRFVKPKPTVKDYLTGKMPPEKKD